MNKDDIREAWEFQLQLAQVLLTGKWRITPGKVKFSSTVKPAIAKDGTVTLSNSYNSSREMRTSMNILLVDAFTGKRSHENFIWQIWAKKMCLIQDITADDMCYCKHCDNITPLTRTKVCVPCRSVIQAVTSNPELARQTLDRITPLEYTEEEKYELGIETDD